MGEAMEYMQPNVGEEEREIEINHSSSLGVLVFLSLFIYCNSWKGESIDLKIYFVIQTYGDSSTVDV